MSFEREFESWWNAGGFGGGGGVGGGGVKSAASGLASSQSSFTDEDALTSPGDTSISSLGATPPPSLSSPLDDGGSPREGLPYLTDDQLDFLTELTQSPLPTTAEKQQQEQQLQQQRFQLELAIVPKLQCAGQWPTMEQEVDLWSPDDFQRNPEHHKLDSSPDVSPDVQRINFYNLNKTKQQQLQEQPSVLGQTRKMQINQPTTTTATTTTTITAAKTPKDNITSPGSCPICRKAASVAGGGCQGCRAFFRRAMTNGEFRHFTCTCGTRCRRPCRSCRLKKCIKAGMKVNKTQLFKYIF